MSPWKTDKSTLPQCITITEQVIRVSEQLTRLQVEVFTDLCTIFLQKDLARMDGKYG